MRETFAELDALFRYEPDTGNFFWRVDRVSGNGTVLRHAGDRAGHRDPRGYWKLTFNGRDMVAHRVAYLLMTGAWPTNQIDHKDRDPGNNRWSNLRPATQQQNTANATLRKGRKYKGVAQNGNGWSATCRVDGKHHYLGYFALPEDAARAYDRAAHAIYGEFAVLNFPKEHQHGFPL